MADSTLREQEYHCEDCRFLDDAPVPSECGKGHGQVAYLHKPCESFQLRNQVAESEGNPSKEN
jgi:hypothetical protein